MTKPSLYWETERYFVYKGSFELNVLKMGTIWFCRAMDIPDRWYSVSRGLETRKHWAGNVE